MTRAPASPIDLGAAHRPPPVAHSPVPRAYAPWEDFYSFFAVRIQEAGSCWAVAAKLAETTLLAQQTRLHPLTPVIGIAGSITVE